MPLMELKLQPTPLERATLRLYLTGNVFQGLWWAGYLLIPYVLAKSLAAPAGLITLTVMMDNLGMFFALYWGYLLATRGGRRTYLFWAAVLSRLVMLLVLLVHDAGQMVMLLAVIYFFAAMVYPAHNSIFEANFRPELRGRYFGLGSGIQNSVAVVASIGIGRILDYDAGLFRIVYAALAVAGAVYMLMMARVPEPEGQREAEPARVLGAIPLPTLPVGPFTPGRILRGLVRPFTDAVAVYRRDRAFNWFETNFMTYGAAFMCLSPVVPLFMTNSLHLNYQEISMARVMIGQIGVAALGPLMGRVMDRYHPVRLSGISFALIALYPVGLALAGLVATGTPSGAAGGSLLTPVRLVYLAFLLYSLGMAGINVAWNVGTIAFAPAGQGGYYQGIHVAMVGIRGTLGPIAGFAVYELFGLNAVFALAFALFVAASISSVGLWRWMRRRPAAASAPAAGRVEAGA